MPSSGEGQPLYQLAIAHIDILIVNYRFVGNQVVVCITDEVKAGEEINNSYGK